jgi:hypothetical protein
MWLRAWMRFRRLYRRQEGGTPAPKSSAAALGGWRGSERADCEVTLPCGARGQAATQRADAADLLRALIGFAYVNSAPDWEASARRLIDLLIDGLKSQRGEK